MVVALRVNLELKGKNKKNIKLWEQRINISELPLQNE